MRLLLREDAATLSDQADLLLAGEGTRLLLAVDQLEEVFTQAEAEERDALVQNLLAAALPEGGRVTVVTALRADFLGRALEHSRELAEAVKTAGAMVMPMAEDELREAVVRPAVQSAQAKRDLSVSLSKLGNVASTGGDLGAARGYFQRSLEIDEALVAADPESAQAKRDLSISLERLANVALRLGELARARQHLDRALELSKATADAHPTDPYLRRTELIQHLQALGLAAQAEDPDALRHHGEAIEEILAAFDARGLFRGDAQVERVRELMEILRPALDDLEP